MEKQTVVFDIVEPKKHSICFKTDDPDAPIKSVYVMRAKLGEVTPEKIRITLEEA
jgi:hypothetical protein